MSSDTPRSAEQRLGEPSAGAFVTLSEVKSWMRFFGWSNQVGPGAVKHDADGRTVVGYHGDAMWRADLAESERLTDSLARRRDAE